MGASRRFQLAPRNRYALSRLSLSKEAGMAGGWLIAVLIEIAGEPKPLRHYFAIGHEDQGKAEWTAVDWAQRTGRVASSPIGGQEPVEAVRALSPGKMKILGLAQGEVRELGWRHPRRWLTG
jgi:hypothetical protein